MYYFFVDSKTVYHVVNHVTYIRFLAIYDLCTCNENNVELDVMNRGTSVAIPRVDNLALVGTWNVLLLSYL